MYQELVCTQLYRKGFEQTTLWSELNHKASKSEIIANSG